MPDLEEANHTALAMAAGETDSLVTSVCVYDKSLKLVRKISMCSVCLSFWKTKKSEVERHSRACVHRTIEYDDNRADHKMEIHAAVAAAEQSGSASSEASTPRQNQHSDKGARVCRLHACPLDLSIPQSGSFFWCATG